MSAVVGYRSASGLVWCLTCANRAAGRLGAPIDAGDPDGGERCTGCLRVLTEACPQHTQFPMTDRCSCGPIPDTVEHRPR